MGKCLQPRLTGFLWINMLLLCFACHSGNSTGAAVDDKNVNLSLNTGPGFRFSAIAPVTGGTVVDNWCLGAYSEPTVLNAEKENMNRRYFYLSPGVTKIVIGPTGISSVFLLRPVENDIVEIYNGDHFPECLSMHANFSLDNGGKVMRYHNHKNVTFSMEIRIDQGHPLITFEFPENNRYLMSVNHCSNCE